MQLQSLVTGQVTPNGSAAAAAAAPTWVPHPQMCHELHAAAAAEIAALGWVPLPLLYPALAAAAAAWVAAVGSLVAAVLIATAICSCAELAVLVTVVMGGPMTMSGSTLMAGVPVSLRTATGNPIAAYPSQLYCLQTPLVLSVVIELPTGYVCHQDDANCRASPADQSDGSRSFDSLDFSRARCFLFRQ